MHMTIMHLIRCCKKPVWLVCDVTAVMWEGEVWCSGAVYTRAHTHTHTHTHTTPK